MFQIAISLIRQKDSGLLTLWTRWEVICWKESREVTESDLYRITLATGWENSSNRKTTAIMQECARTAARNVANSVKLFKYFE